MSQAFADLFIQSYENLYVDVCRGLTQSKQKSIPSYYFYDDKGMIYHDEMKSSPEYYITPCEISILHKFCDEIQSQLGENLTIFELGVNDSIKTRLLLDSMPENTHYVAIDHKKESLENHVEQLNCIYETMMIDSIEQNFHENIVVPESIKSSNQDVIFFSDAQIGSLSPEEAIKFLKSLKKQFKKGTKLLIGNDLLKSSNILEAAYDDKKGCSSRFNLNLLSRINKELSTNFDLHNFKHRVIFNRQQNRVEMHLVSLAHQRVNINGQEMFFNKGESIHTKSAYKYSQLKFTQLLAEAGWKSEKHWNDSKNWYSLQLASC